MDMEKMSDIEDIKDIKESEEQSPCNTKENHEVVEGPKAEIETPILTAKEIYKVEHLFEALKIIQATHFFAMLGPKAEPMETLSDKPKGDMEINPTASNWLKKLSLGITSTSEQGSQDADVNDTAKSPELPIVPDFDIDYENIYADVTKLSDIEKHLQLLYRPFVCEMNVNCRFNMLELCILLSDSRYEPGFYPALFVRIRDPSAVVKVFAGGKIVCEGATAEAARLGLMKVIQIVQDMDYKADIEHFSQNIVHASFSMPFKIDLEKLADTYPKLVSCNRETRPFITYKMVGTTIRFAVFSNGYVLVLHSNKHSETRAAIAVFLPILQQCKNGFLTHTEKYGSLDGDITYKLLWEHKLEDDKDGLLLYS